MKQPASPSPAESAPAKSTAKSAAASPAAPAEPAPPPGNGLAGRRVLFVGGGNMAVAMISGLVAAGVAGGAITVIEPLDSARAALGERFGVRAFADAAAVAADATDELPPIDAIVLAVKPQQAEVALQACRPLFARWPRAVLISIAAGTTVATIAAASGGHRSIVRAMPNTPSLIGAGIAGLYAPAGTPDTDRALAAAVLGSTGRAIEVDREALIDTVTAVSGSGPAYAFYLMEAMIAGGIAGGLSPHAARELALHTVRGAALLALASDEPPEVLRRRVTSPGGTTAAAIAVMDRHEVQRHLQEAVAAAAARGRELAAPPPETRA